MVSTILKRKTNTVSQTTLNREERLQNMEKAFVTSRPLKEFKFGIIDEIHEKRVPNQTAK